MLRAQYDQQVDHGDTACRELLNDHEDADRRQFDDNAWCDLLADHRWLERRTEERE